METLTKYRIVQQIYRVEHTGNELPWTYLARCLYHFLSQKFIAGTTTAWSEAPSGLQRSLRSEITLTNQDRTIIHCPYYRYWQYIVIVKVAVTSI